MSQDGVQRNSLEPVKRGVGQPKKVPPEHAAQLIQAAAAAGANMLDIARKFRIAKETLGNWLDDYPEIRTAYDYGREAEREKLHNKMVSDALEGEKANTNAMFILKARHGYVEGEKGEKTQLNVIVTMPGALSREDWIKTAVKSD
jgi:transposase-like protein